MTGMNVLMDNQDLIHQENDSALEISVALKNLT